MNTAIINGLGINASAVPVSVAPLHTVFTSTGSRHGLDFSRSTGTQHGLAGSTGTRGGIDPANTTGQGH